MEKTNERNTVRTRVKIVLEKNQRSYFMDIWKRFIKEGSVYNIS